MIDIDSGDNLASLVECHQYEVFRLIQKFLRHSTLAESVQLCMRLMLVFFELDDVA